MTISGVSSLYSNSMDSTTSISSLMQLAQSTTSSTPLTDSTGSATASASIDISSPGKMMSKLAILQQTDPDKFKQVMSDMAAKLNALAQQESSTSSTDGSGGSQSLADLANKFASAAQTGDLSAFQPAPSSRGTSASNAYGPHNNVAFPVSGLHHHKHGVKTLPVGSGYGSNDAASATSSDSASASTSQNPLADLFSQLNQEVASSLQTTSAAS